MAVKTLLEAIREAMQEEMRRDDAVMVMGEDVGLHGGVFRATDGLQKEFGELRVLDTPLAESLIAGLAIGAAANGMRPIAEMQFADFIFPAMNQIVSEAARMRYRSNGDWNCPMVVRAPFGGGIHGAMYHSQSVEAIFAHVPGLKIVATANPADAKGLLKSAIRDDDPVLFFEHKGAYRRVKGEVPDGDYTIPLGVADVKREGTDITVISYGNMVYRALEAAEQLQEQGVSLEVIDLRTVAPFDKETVAKSVRKTSRAIIFHEDSKSFGVGAEVAAFIAEELYDDIDSPVLRVAAPDGPAMPYNHTLEAAYLPGVEHLLAAVQRLVSM